MTSDPTPNISPGFDGLSRSHVDLDPGLRHPLQHETVDDGEADADQRQQDVVIEHQRRVEDHRRDVDGGNGESPGKQIGELGGQLVYGGGNAGGSGVFKQGIFGGGADPMQLDLLRAAYTS